MSIQYPAPEPLDLLASLNSYEKVNKYVVPNPKQFKWKSNKKTVGNPKQQMGYFSITNTIGQVFQLKFPSLS